MAVIDGNSVGNSKNRSLYGIYSVTKSVYSTQDGNAALGGVTVVGGFGADATYIQKYAGGDGDYGKGASIGHSEMEVLSRVTEKPSPVLYRG